MDKVMRRLHSDIRDIFEVEVDSYESYLDVWNNSKLAGIKNTRIKMLLFQFLVMVNNINVVEILVIDGFNNINNREISDISSESLELINSYKYYKVLYTQIISLQSTFILNNLNSKKLNRLWINAATNF